MKVLSMIVTFCCLIIITYSTFVCLTTPTDCNSTISKTPTIAEAITPQRITLVTEQSFGLYLRCYILNADGQEFLVTCDRDGVSTVPLKKGDK